MVEIGGFVLAEDIVTVEMYVGVLALYVDVDIQFDYTDVIRDEDVDIDYQGYMFLIFQKTNDCIVVEELIFGYLVLISIVL